jgi:hypothetical protein
MKSRVTLGMLAGAGLLALLSAPSVFAQSFTASNTSAVINTTGHVATLNLNTNGVAIGGVQLVLDYTGTHLTAASAVSSDANLTCDITVANRVSCGSFAPVANGTTVTINFNVLGVQVPSPGSPLVFNPDLITGSFFLDAGFARIPTTLNNGSVIIGTAPPDVNLTFAPAPGGTVSFPAGVALTTQNASIGITGSGTVGSGTVTGCGITGAGAAAFGAPPAGTITVTGGGTGTIPLTCTLPNSGGAATATLTCTETDANSPAPGAARSWTLSCPQGTPVPGPGFGASPAPNTPATAISCSGQAGSTVQRQIAITNNGNPGAGSGLDFTCTGGGIVSIVSGGTATGLAVGASQTVTVACAVPADGVTSIGGVSCTSNAPSSPFVFNYSSTGSTFPPPVPRPAVVPASSAWSQIALIALLAGLGLAFVGFRRGQ